MIRILGALDGTIARIEAFILGAGVLLMAINSIANVLGRFVFGQSIYFTEELNEFLIVLVTWVGLGYAARKGRHIRMSAIYDQLSDRGRKVLMIVIALVTAAIMFTLAWYAYGYVERLARLGKVTPSLQVPLWLTYLWVPLGFVITGIQYVMTALRNLTTPGVWISWEQIDAYDEVDELVAEGEPAPPPAARQAGEPAR